MDGVDNHQKGRAAEIVGASGEGDQARGERMGTDERMGADSLFFRNLATSLNDSNVHRYTTLVMGNSQPNMPTYS